MIHRLSCLAVSGILVPRAGIEPTTPALQGRFLVTGLPGKYLQSYFSKVKFPFTVFYAFTSSSLSYSLLIWLQMLIRI